MKKPICKILRTNKINNFMFTVKYLMTLDRSYIGYLGFLGIDFIKKAYWCILQVLFASADYFLKWVFLQCTGASGLGLVWLGSSIKFILFIYFIHLFTSWLSWFELASTFPFRKPFFCISCLWVFLYLTIM